MKTNYLLILFSFVSLNVFSQKKEPTGKESFIRLGFKAGLNVNKIQGQSFKSGFNYNYQLGGF